MKKTTQNQNAFQFSQSIQTKLENSCKTFMDHIGATKFHYFRLYQGGKFLILSNDTSLTENLLFLPEENAPSLMEVIQTVQKNKLLFHQARIEGDNDPMIRVLRDFWGQTNIIYSRHESYVDAVSFTNHLSSEQHAIFCANNIPILKTLYWGVCEEINLLIPQNNPKIFAQFPKGADIALRPTPVISHSKEEHLDLLKGLSIFLKHHQPYLTNREWQICLGLMRGETAKETSDALKINTRTVENHLNNVYQKLMKQWGFRPTRAQIMEKLYGIIDKDLLTYTLWAK